MIKLNHKLQQTKGIGPALAKQICLYLGVSIKTSYKMVNYEKIDQLNKLYGFLRKLNKPTLNKKIGSLIFSPIDSHLNLYIKEKILHTINQNNYKGKRHKLGFPVRGQRTRCNYKTARRLNKSRWK